MCVLADSQGIEVYGAYPYSQARLMDDESERMGRQSEICSIVEMPGREAKQRLTEIVASGYPMKEGVVNNSYRFVNALVDFGIIPEADEISYTAYGNVVMDLDTPRGLVSIEIGKQKIGFFTEFENGEDFASDGIETDFKSVPDYLKTVLLKSL